ncbi:MAG TPA: PQQ-dependent sugar dehydrogenase [Candidatus Didemnitutus sp.]|nr:PQQ-dependent sugar dehydrogenase [Candidatus Didemnitutus sp.]
MVTPLRSVLAVSILSLAAVKAASGADAGDADKGHLFFQQSCALCHATTPAGGGGQGPSLLGVVGRRAASTTFGYSKALIGSGLVWDAATLDRFLENPQRTVPGTLMPIPVPNSADRRNVIAFLATLKAPSESTGGNGPGAVSPEVDRADWRNDHPGATHKIVLAELPPPFRTRSAGNGPQVVDQPAGAHVSVPDGFTIKEFATGLSNPRCLRVAPNGDLFIAETGSDRIRVLRAADGAESPSQNEIFATGLDRPFGIAFYPNGNDPQWVYVANNNSVVRFPYHRGDLKATAAAQVIVPKLSGSTGGHSTRDIAFSPDGKRLYISVGSGSNVAEEISTKTSAEVAAWEAQHGFGAAWDSETNRANVMVTDPEGTAPIHAFATGIRNPVGFGIDPVSGELWTSTNERDGLGDDLVPDYVTSVKEGHYYGWPWYYLGNHEDPRRKGERPDLAGKATVPDVLLQAHSAALGIVFYPDATGAAAFPAEYRGDIFVALHGSWNRANRTGYKVIRIRRHNGIPTGEYEDFATGFVVDGRSVWGRPVGIAVAHDGALLFSEDGHNVIYRVTPTK